MSVNGRSETPDTAAVANLEAVITPGQLELLALYASGYSYGDIGSIKFLSKYTVRNKLTLALERSGCRSLTHLCMALLEARMVQSAADGHYEPVAQDLRVAG
jgi:DNA-binding NarL/FixJ family response regulator